MRKRRPRLNERSERKTGKEGSTRNNKNVKRRGGSATRRQLVSFGKRLVGFGLWTLPERIIRSIKRAGMQPLVGK